MQIGLRRIASLLAATTLVASSGWLAPVSARAAVMDNDVLGAIRVGKSAALRAQAPDLSIPSGILMTMDGRVLWARDPDARRAMASTTKIMTAVVALEKAGVEGTVTVDKTAAMVGQSSMGLVQGETFTMGELLKGVLVQSGNDAATLVAEHVGGSVSAFVAMMNAKAAALDLTNTHYANPHGLDQAGHYTSAADLAALARYAMRIPVFREIVGTYKVNVRSDRYTHVLQSHNDLLKSYAGSEGIKTGWTNNAGYCVVVAVKRGDIELLGVVMGAASEGDRSKQAKRLLDWGFAHYKPVEVTTSGRSYGTVPVSDYVDVGVTAVNAEATSLAVLDAAGPIESRVEMLASVRAPVRTGDRVGTLNIYQGPSLLAQLPLTADHDVRAPNLLEAVGIFFIRLWNGISSFFTGLWRAIFG
ncbi:MAG TPA: D-alanyl-D-alanine carboxypeptidase family protein [Coriobacteriia bacterium]